MSNDMSDLWFINFCTQLPEQGPEDEKFQLQQLLKRYPSLQQAQLKMLFSQSEQLPEQLQSSWVCSTGSSIELSCFKIELLQLVQDFITRRNAEQDPWFEGLIAVQSGEIDIHWLE